MSDAILLPEAGAAEPRRTPTVYFIDDSATMREVIKIAFRRENINVVTCADAASAQVITWMLSRRNAILMTSRIVALSSIKYTVGVRFGAA